MENRICNKCMHGIPAESQFCPFCGNRLKSEKGAEHGVLHVGYLFENIWKVAALLQAVILVAFGIWLSCIEENYVFFWVCVIIGASIGLICWGIGEILRILRLYLSKREF